MRQETWEVIIIIGERGIIYCVPVAACRRRHRVIVVVVTANCLCASACNGICSYMLCDVLTLIMRRGSAFYAEGTNRGTIAEDSSQKELTDRAVSLLHDLRSRVLFWVSG